MKKIGVELSKQIYLDPLGNEWVLEKVCLPKRKGEYSFWIAECEELRKSFRENLKRSVLKQITEFAKTKKEKFLFNNQLLIKIKNKNHGNKSI